MKGAAVAVASVLVVGACAAAPFSGHRPSHPTTTTTGVTTSTTILAAVPADMLNPNVTQATIRTTICVKGWTATIRPPQSYTGPLKIHQIKTYGYSDTNPADYEEDHALPLIAGGNPTNPANLWPEPKAVFPADDALEVSLGRDVCAGKKTLAAAQLEVYRAKVRHGYDRAKSLG